MRMRLPTPRPRADAPVGIFDSGVGGLSVLRAIRAQLPDESLLYCGDSRYAPYGERDDDFVADRTLAIGDWLVARGVKALVVACNTATAQTIPLLRERLPVPVVGVEPGIKPAAAASASRVVGVLATAVTLRSARFQRLLAEHGGQCKFICQAGHGLVEAIERGAAETAAAPGATELDALLRAYLAPMLAAGADTLVLGSTHFPFLDQAIARIAGPRLNLIETGPAVARQLGRLLQAQGLLAGPGADADAASRLCSTGDGAQLQALAQRLLNLRLPVEPVVINSRRTLQPATSP
jgi:glutamate racemase